MRTALVFVSLLFATTASAFECSTAVTPTQIDDMLGKAEASFIDLDEVGFRDNVNVLAGVLLPCVDRALPQETVAHYHRVMALHLYVVGDETGAFAAADAAKLIQPDTGYTDELLVADHPLRLHFDGAEPDDSTRKIPEPRAGAFSFDGNVGRNRPKTLPTIAQKLDEQGLAKSTSYLAPRETLPPYRAIPRQRTTLALASGAALIASGTLYGLAWASNSNLKSAARDQTTSRSALDGKRQRTNALVLGSSAFLGVSIGTGVGAALIGER